MIKTDNLMKNNLKIAGKTFAFVFSVFFIAACSTTQDIVEDPETGEFRVPERVSQSRQVQSERLLIDAAKARMLEDYEEALRLFRQAARVDPNNDAARFELARIYYALDMFNESMREMNAVIKISPNNKWYHIFYAELLAVDGRYSDAAKAYKKVLELDPDFIDAYYDWAFMLIQSENYADAIDVYEQLERIIGPDEKISVQRHQLYMHIGEREKAIQVLQELIKNNPDEIRFYGLLGEIYEEEGDYEGAIEVYEKLLIENENNPFAILSLANAYLQLDQREKYFDYLLKAFNIETLDIDAKIGVLITYVEHLEDSVMAEEAFKLADIVLEQHPDNAKTYAVYADLLYHANREAEALKKYKKTLELDKSVFMVWQQVFFILVDKGEYDSLAYYTSEAIEYFPNQAVSYYFNGFALNQLERYNESVQILTEASLIAADNVFLKAQIYASLGDAYYSLKDYEESFISYERSLELDPENPYVLNNYSYYLSLRRENLEEAEKMSRKSNELVENNAAFLDTYAWIQYQKGNYETAKKWLEKALEHGGDDQAVILDHYGDVLYQLGEIDRAVDYWQKAKNLGLESDVISRKIEDRTIYEE